MAGRMPAMHAWPTCVPERADGRDKANRQLQSVIQCNYTDGSADPSTCLHAMPFFEPRGEFRDPLSQWRARYKSGQRADRIN